MRRRLLIPLLVSGAGTIFGLGALAMNGRPSPDVLARTFAIPPMDTFGDLELTDGPFSPWAAAIFVARVALVTAALALVLGVRPNRRTFAKVGGVYLLSLLSMAVPVLAGLGYVNFRQDVVGEGSAVSALLLLAFPLVLVVLATMLAPLAGRVVADQSIALHLRRPLVWGLCALSTLIWLFAVSALKQPPGEALSAGRYVLAFVVIVAQSVIYGAVALASIEESQPSVSAE
ncbi:MAG: hypothetical protein M3164_02615 [Actinomycetota bacterium]|nr:hypothetical protein [Actinomycetota bacterium]